MKLKSIRISNILSFPFKENFNETEIIGFESNNGSDLHILIGPNGSGKSNFLEVLNQILKSSLFKQCIINTGALALKDTNHRQFLQQKNGVLSTPEKNLILLEKNWDSNPDQNEQRIELIIDINKNDISNLNFVVDNSEDIDKYFQEYSNHNPNFTSKIGSSKREFKQGLKESEELRVSLSRDSMGGGIFSPSIEGGNNYLHFIHLYLEYFEFIQKIIELYNKFNKSNWPILKNTFILIGSFRNYNTVEPSYSAGNPNSNDFLNNLTTRRYNDNTIQSTVEEPIVFSLVKHKLSYDGFRLFDDKSKNKKEIVPKLYKTSLYKNINILLREFLGLSLVIELQSASNWTFTFNIKNKKRIVPFANLSAGQKGIIHLIFSLYGFDIENGLIIIDEPELHLHPQLKKKYLEIVKRESNKRNIQFIIATHSPAFVNEKTIRNVRRFYYDEAESASKSICPEINEEVTLLLQILTYTNSSKIFFVDKVILVEGPSDDYFYNFYIESLKEKVPDIGNYEILNLEGKGAWDKWKSFLEKWGIKVYYIGDWDNVKGFGLVDSSWKTQINTMRSASPKKSYPEIIRILKSSSPAKFKSLNQKISYRYKMGLYILKKGELEDYLGISNKKIAAIIEYCNNYSEKPKLPSELEKIVVNNIFKK